MCEGKTVEIFFFLNEPVKTGLKFKILDVGFHLSVMKKHVQRKIMVQYSSNISEPKQTSLRLLIFFFSLDVPNQNHTIFSLIFALKQGIVKDMLD